MPKASEQAAPENVSAEAAEEEDGSERGVSDH